MSEFKVIRSDDEIVAYVREAHKPFDFRPEVLVPMLPFDKAKEFLAEGATEEEWDEVYPQARDDAIEHMRSYLVFGIEKALNHRGLSASRTIQKMQAWAWAMGLSDIEEATKNDDLYRPYGAPTLGLIVDAIRAPYPDSEEWRRMRDGEPCAPDCEEGCLR